MSPIYKSPIPIYTLGLLPKQIIVPLYPLEFDKSNLEKVEKWEREREGESKSKTSILVGESLYIDIRNN